MHDGAKNKAWVETGIEKGRRRGFVFFLNLGVQTGIRRAIFFDLDFGLF